MPKLLALLAVCSILVFAQTPPAQMPSGPFVAPLVVLTSSTNHTVTAAEMQQNTMLVLTAAVTVTVPQSGTSGFEAKRSMFIVNASGGTVTVLSTTSQFLGGGFNSTTATLAPGQSMIIASGSNSGTPIWGTALLNLGGSGGGGGGLIWSALTDGQWAALTNGQWAGLS